MDRIHDMYQKITGKNQVPKIMEIPHGNGQNMALDEFLREHFGEPLEPVLSGTDPVDTFFELRRRAGRLDCRILMVHHDGSENVSRYIELCDTDDSTLREQLEKYSDGDSVRLHLHGPDTITALRLLGPYFNPDYVKRITGEHPYGFPYEQDGYRCIDVLLTNERGLHARPSTAIASLFKEKRYEMTEVLIQKGEQQSNASSIMGLLALAATKGTELTIKTKGPQAKGALQEVYAKFVEVNERKHS